MAGPHRQFIQSPQFHNPAQLNGWKEIAGLLGKSVRTAERWEKELRLPVHRIHTSAGEIVYALRTEIEQWQAQAEHQRDRGPQRQPERGEFLAALRILTLSRPPLPLSPRCLTCGLVATARRARIWRFLALLALALLLGILLAWSERHPAHANSSPRSAVSASIVESGSGCLRALRASDPGPEDQRSRRTQASSSAARSQTAPI
ncbi:MAG: hypothetical protein HY237_06680 [Acidobacteria bacterium]|nr:hypothetical protein [Acidobacteriota bacterium]